MEFLFLLVWLLLGIVAAVIALLKKPSPYMFCPFCRALLSGKHGNTCPHCQKKLPK